MTRRLGSARWGAARGRRSAWWLAAAVVLGVGVAACGKKASEPSGPPPEITGLAAVPATAQVVIGVDVGKLLDSQVVERAVDQLLLHNPVLSERWQHLRDDCKIDLGKQLKRVMLAIGP